MTMSFLKSETGAVTVDWVVLTAALVGLGLATMAVVSSGSEDLSNDIKDELTNDQFIQTSFRNLDYCALAKEWSAIENGGQSEDSDEEAQYYCDTAIDLDDSTEVVAEQLTYQTTQAEFMDALVAEIDRQIAEYGTVSDFNAFSTVATAYTSNSFYTNVAGLESTFNSWVYDGDASLYREYYETRSEYQDALVYLLEEELATRDDYNPT